MRLAIAQIGTADEGGGAAAVAQGLMRGYAARGHRVWHLVGRQRSGNPNVILLPDDDRATFRATGYTALQSGLRRLAGRFPDRGFGLLSRSLRLATHPGALVSYWRGREDFDYPGTRRLFQHLGTVPDVVHGHNLQGGYFDLRELTSISARVLTVLTLHDMWLLTGHCAHALGCERWQSGCGRCPDLRLDPAVRRDATAENWQGKQTVYGRSRLHIATPSEWLRQQVAASMLRPLSMRVIPNGVDTEVFRPADRAAVRAALGLPADAFIVLLTTGSRGSMWKDDRTLRDVMNRLADRPGGPPVEWVAVGRESVAAVKSQAKIRSISYQHDPRDMARYYQAADLYLHATRADTFPLAVLEAMACGTPVVASRVGGIPEQIREVDVTEAGPAPGGGVGDATGVLVPLGDGAAMADAVQVLRARGDLRASLGANAVTRVARQFTLTQQVDAYLAWYRELLDQGSATEGARR